MLSALGRDLINSNKRIFDHSGFVSGEISSFLQNFELKRNDAEVEKLFKATETVGELKYDLTERCLALSAKNIHILQSDLKTLLTQVNNFLDKAQEIKPPSLALQEAREERARKKAEICVDFEHKQQRIDNYFEEKEEEITELYSDLQQKLNIPK